MATHSSDAELKEDWPRYGYRPSLLGAAMEFRLAPDALEWQAGRRGGRISYPRISRVRLSFRPVTMQSHRFLTEIWSQDAPKLEIASTSWKGIVEQERHDAAYAAFVRELHRRMAAAGAAAAFQSGTAAFLYWPGLAIFAAAAVVLAVLLVQSAFSGTWTSMAVIGALFALLLWQVGGIFRRNRPATYQPLAPPPEVLPRA